MKLLMKHFFDVYSKFSKNYTKHYRICYFISTVFSTVSFQTKNVMNG